MSGLGGQDTLRSYGLDFSLRRRLSAVHDEALRAVPKAHRDFLAGCRLTFETGEFVLLSRGHPPWRRAARSEGRRSFVDSRRVFGLRRKPSKAHRSWPFPGRAALPLWQQNKS